MNHIMELQLIRTKHRGESLEGLLKVDGEKLCDTAENIVGSLPPGTYHIARHFCKQYNRFVPRILKPGETREQLETFCRACPKIKGASNNTILKMYCPQLKMGNGIHHRDDGSIILGTTIVPGCLKDTREPYENLSERLRKLAGRGSEVTLTISLIPNH